MMDSVFGEPSAEREGEEKEGKWPPLSDYVSGEGPGCVCVCVCVCLCVCVFVCDHLKALL